MRLVSLPRFVYRKSLYAKRYALSRLGYGTTPDFLIIGAQRSGTTTLYDYMCSHRECRPALQKEVDYFTFHSAQSSNYYEAYFPSQQLLTGRGKARQWKTGEATPYYLFHPDVPRLVHEYNPNMRLIVLLRNPIDRAFSHYLHERRMGRESLSFRDALDSEQCRLMKMTSSFELDSELARQVHRNKSYIERGFYVQQLARWASYFEKNQILIIQSEHFYSEPLKWTEKALEHIGLSTRNFIIPDNYEVDSLGQKSRMKEDDYQFLTQVFRDEAERLSEYTGQVFDWNF